jgi:hypothetical protein
MLQELKYFVTWIYFMYLGTYACMYVCTYVCLGNYVSIRIVATGGLIKLYRKYLKH